MTRNGQSEFVTGSKSYQKVCQWECEPSHLSCAMKYQNYDFLLFDKFVITKRQSYFIGQNFFANSMSKQNNKKSFGK